MITESFIDAVIDGDLRTIKLCTADEVLSRIDNEKDGETAYNLCESLRQLVDTEIPEVIDTEFLVLRDFWKSGNQNNHGESRMEEAITRIYEFYRTEVVKKQNGK